MKIESDSFISFRDRPILFDGRTDGWVSISFYHPVAGDKYNNIPAGGEVMAPSLSLLVNKLCCFTLKLPGYRVFTSKEDTLARKSLIISMSSDEPHKIEYCDDCNNWHKVLHESCIVLPQLLELSQFSSSYAY